jgi:hypothetical protein
VAAYSFVTHWHFQALPERVWQVVTAGPSFTEWWPNVVYSKHLTPDVTGIGSSYERVIRGRLPYNLRFVSTTTLFEPPREFTYDAVGDLVGRGRWVFEPNGGGTVLTIYWDVVTIGFWMNLLAPVLKGVFAWNHNQVMRRGERGLAQWLAANPVQADDEPLVSGKMKNEK